MLNAGGFESIEEADSFARLKETRALQIGSSIILCLVRHSDEITQATNAVRACNTSASIVFVLPKVEIDLVRLCYAAGASGCVAETVSGEGLRRSLHLIAIGEKVFPSELARMLPLIVQPERLKADSGEDCQARFSQREIEILLRSRSRTLQQADSEEP
jgi:two-component system nitrate/nitrite response regulator NarL